MFGKRRHIDFSIIMPTYNRAFCIKNAIDSVLAQDYPNFELLVVDDGSSDNTEELILNTYPEEIKNGKIIYARFAHSGVSHTRNMGLRLAKNPWIAYIDTDNTMEGSFLSSFAEVMSAKTAECYYCKIAIRSKGITIGKRFKYKRLKESNYIDMGAFVHSKKLYQKYGGFDENLKRFEDWDLVLNYTAHYKPVFIDKVLVDYNDSQAHERISNSEKNIENADIVKRKHGFIK